MHNILLIIVLYFLINQSFATIRVENITVIQGENVRFDCQFPSDISFHENIIQWTKFHSNEDNILISINGKIRKEFEKSYQTILTDQTSSFDVLRVNREDSTTYICQTFETQTILCQYNLVVLIKPEAPSLTINKENIEEYQAVTLTCSSFNGNPPPQYTWYRNSILITSPNEQVITTKNSSIYTFNVTRFDNNVQYECQIWNQALTIPLRIEQYLHVKYQPYVKILEEETTIFSSEQNQIRKIIGIEHQQLNLTCHYDANPPPTTIYWLTNSTTIVSREKSVYIPRLRSEQSGIYTCIVENIIGKVNQSVYLDVQYAPRVRSIASRILVNHSDSVVLRCLVDSNPPPYKTIWLKNNTEIHRDSQLADLYLTQVERNHSDLYTCVVYNRFYNNQTSNSSNTIELVVQSRPIIETTYSKVAAEIGQSVMLICRVIGQPKPNVFWKHNEKMIPCYEIINDICYLHFSKILMEDFGTYRCIAENLLGHEEWSYTIVSRGKPETPKDIVISDITSSSFKVQFTPSFDGGSGSQKFFIQVADASNSSIINHQIPVNTYEYHIKGLNESTLYKLRIKSINTYGESPWSHEVPLETRELIMKADDLPQLYAVSYNPREHLVQLNYLPDSPRIEMLNEEYLCLNIRQSTDRKLYESVPQCLTILNRRVRWKLEKEYSYLKLSICSKRNKTICGNEIDMNDEIKTRNSTPIVIGIFVMTSFLVLIIIIFIVIVCTRVRKHRLTSNVNKFGMIVVNNGTRPTISEPRLQKPYLLYTNSNTISSPYNYDYQQKNISNSRSHSSDINDGEQCKDEIQYGTTMRTATIHTSPHWSRSNSRSGSNPSSESSCITQNTNIIYANNEIHTNPNSVLVSHYGFPPIISSLQQTSSIIQSSSSSENSTPNRMKKLFYEVVV